MKIVLVTFLYEVSLGGGAAHVVNTLAHDLVVCGHDVTVITTAPVKQPTIDYDGEIKIIRFFPTNLYWVYEKDKKSTVNKILFQLLDTWNPFVYNTLKNILERENPDVIHVHKLRGISPSAWSAASSIGVKNLIHTCHDYELFSPQGWLSGHIGRGAVNRNLIFRPYQTLRAHSSNPVKHATAPSRFALDLHTKMHFFRNSRCHVIPNSHGYSITELIRLRNRMAGKTRQKKSISLLYAGRLVPEKGVADLCEAVKICIDEQLDVDLHLIGTGAFEEYLKEKYSQVRQIHFEGQKGDREKEIFFEQADLLVLPSCGPEIFGIVLTEAYAFGLPVIATRVGGIPEVVKEGETGYLVPPGDPVSLAKKIREIADNRNRLESMRQACFSIAEIYSTENFTRQYLAVYHDLS